MTREADNFKAGPKQVTRAEFEALRRRVTRLEQLMSRNNKVDAVSDISIAPVLEKQHTLSTGGER